MVKIILGRYIVNGNVIEGPVDLMTQKINPSKISPYFKKLLTREKKKRKKSRQLRKNVSLKNTLKGLKSIKTMKVLGLKIYFLPLRKEHFKRTKREKEK
jgi:hypothetical protein